MIRPLLTTKAVILVVLASVQTLFFAMLPMVDYWRDDIESALSDRFAAEVTLAQLGAKASLTGPYLEAHNVIVDRDDGRFEAQRVQILLNLMRSVAEGRPVISDLVVDEAELVLHGAAGGLPDPKTWANLLTELRQVLKPVGDVKVNNLQVIAGSLSINRLSLDVAPNEGALARGRLVTQTLSVPFELDWRFPSQSPEIHDVRVHTRLRNTLLPLAGLDELTATVDATLWASLQTNQPVRGVLRATGRSDQTVELQADITGAFALFGGWDARVRMDAAHVSAPGLRVSGAGGAIAYDGHLIEANLGPVRLDGPALAPFLAQFEAPPKLMRLLTNNAPQIDLSALQISGSGDRPLEARAQVDRFAIQASGGVPEIGTLSGDLYLQGSRGWFDFETPSGTFALPEIFPQAWDAHALSGLLAFDRGADGLYIRGDNLRVQGPDQDVQGALMLDLPRNAEQSLQLELLADAGHAALPALLPNDLDEEIRAFLTRSIRDLAVDNARISYSGPLGKSIDRSRRELSMYFPMTRYDFQPLTQWPTFLGQQGSVRFSDQRADVMLTDADFGGLSVAEVRARQNKNDPRQIDVRGDLEGDAQRALEILDAAGVKPDALGQQVKFEGRLRGAVDFAAPIQGQPTGSVSIETEALEVVIQGLAAPLTNVRGGGVYRLQQGFTASDLRGRLLGDAVEMEIEASGDGVTVSGRGQMRTQTMVQLGGLRFTDAQLTGASDWSVSASSAEGILQIALETDGVGIQSALPQPFSKAAQAPGPIQIQLIEDETSRRLEGTIFEQSRVSGRLDQTPLALKINSPYVDLLGWASASGEPDSEANLALMIETDAVMLGEDRLAIDAMAVTRQPGAIEVVIEGEDLQGSISRFGQAPVQMALDRVRLPEGSKFLDPPGEDPLLDYNPGQIPSADIAIGTLYRGEKIYRDLEATLIQGDARLDVTRLVFERDQQRFLGELAWVLEPTGAQTALVLRAKGGAIGNFLRVNEEEPLLEADDGTFSTELTWHGSPLGFSMLTSEGSVELNLNDGRFVDLGNSAEVLRLFGILNIETLTRRLRLDFLDLVQPGVAFDRVSAKGRLENGLLRFDPALEMQGPSSSFRLTGVSNLNDKTLNQRLSVDIPLTNNLPLASILLGAPQVGGTIYLVEKALGTKIIKVGKTDYRIEGAFDDPQIRLIPPFTEKQKDPQNVDLDSNRQ